MKKLVVLAVLIFTSVSMFSQITSQGKPDVLKSFRMGVCKLVDTNGEITIEAITRETERYIMKVHLGTPEEAAVTLASLAEYKPGKGEPVMDKNGEPVIKRDGHAAVQFAVMVGYRPTTKKGGTGYEFTVTPIVQPNQADALGALRDATAKALPAPAQK